VRWLFIRHSPRRFAYNVEEGLLARGDRVDTLRFDAGPRPGDPRAWDAAVVFGGHMYAGEDGKHPWLGDELRWMESALAAGLPLLGVCLGGQLLARLLGAPVGPAPVPEFGYHGIRLTAEGAASPLFAGFSASFRAFLWHDEAFGLPPGAVRLATGDHCPEQAFSWGDRAFALQFHLEFSAGQLRDMVVADAASLPARSACWQEPSAVAADEAGHAAAARSMSALLENLRAMVPGLSP